MLPSFELYNLDFRIQNKKCMLDFLIFYINLLHFKLMTNDIVFENSEFRRENISVALFID